MFSSCLILTAIALIMGSRAHLLTIIIYLEYIVLGLLYALFNMATLPGLHSSNVLVYICLTVSRAAASLTLLVNSIRQVGRDLFISNSAV
jgi:hypothetical protein